MTHEGGRRLAMVCLGVTVTAISITLGLAILSLPEHADGLGPQVQQHLERTGVKNPVTAVLLNFRGYDTLLEVAVLLLAALGARALVGGASERSAGRPEDNPVLIGFARVIAPVMVIVAGYLLWVGGHAPGGAFQAGAVLAALGILLLLARIDWPSRLGPHLERWLLALGLAVFLIAASGMATGGRRWMEYPPEAAKWLILLIETACTISIAAVLIALFAGGRLASPRQSPSIRRRWPLRASGRARRRERLKEARP